MFNSNPSYKLQCEYGSKCILLIFLGLANLYHFVLMIEFSIHFST